METKMKPLTPAMVSALIKLAAASDEVALPARSGDALVSRGLAIVVVDKDRATLGYHFGRVTVRSAPFYTFTYKITDAGRAALKAVR